MSLCDEGATAEEVRAKVELEVLGNLRYVLYEPASEKDFPNGVRDAGRGAIGDAAGAATDCETKSLQK